MKFNKNIKIFLIALVAVHINLMKASPAQPQFPTELTSTGLREGTWVWSNQHHSASRKVRRVVQLIKSNDNWKIIFSTFSHTKESFEEKKPPQVAIEGPYACYVKDGILFIQYPNGILKHSFRFDKDILLLPAVIRTDAQTFIFIFSENSPTTSGKDAVVTWDYTWRCSSDPSKIPNGSANIVLEGPWGKETIDCTYSVEEKYDNPALVFRNSQKKPEGADYITWYNIGPLISENSLSMRRPSFPSYPMRYFPADETSKKVIQELTKKKPNKTDPGDGK